VRWPRLAKTNPACSFATSSKEWQIWFSEKLRITSFLLEAVAKENSLVSVAFLAATTTYNIIMYVAQRKQENPKIGGCRRFSNFGVLASSLL
jgi:hypothetical protein